ncbi:MAG TPA: glutamine amidotransferase [Blastococcus sp.]|nr:glutamine amidotransferase [Blastococcus sp.]
MSGESVVRIAVLLPDVLGTYSDHGNATVLAQRLRWRGIPADILDATADAAPPTDCDVFVLGGGEDAAQTYAARWLTEHPELLAAMQTRQVLAVCAGLQILGHWIQGTDGHRVAGAGLLDLTTSPGPRRAVGEIVTDCTHPGVARLTGFENHRGHTTLGPGSRPLGTVTDGVGNGDGTDGVLTETTVATYLHGPVLARNPDLADLLLHRATGLSLTPLHVPGQEEARRLHLHRPSRAHRPSRTPREHQATP